MAREPENGPVFADERQARIAEHVAVRGRARIGELAELFGVTEPTIRKDLSALQERGLLKRTHGGALSVARPDIDRELAARQAAHMESKGAIARACVGLLRDGDSVFLDSGTTVEAIAREIAGGPAVRLSVLTSSLVVAGALAEVPSVDCVLLGGQVRRMDASVAGDLALENLRRFAFGFAFLGVSGFSEIGISVGSLAEASLKEAVIERAQRIVVPVDHTKVGITDFARISDLEAVDVVVMDEATPAVRDLCAGYDIELVVAGR